MAEAEIDWENVHKCIEYGYVVIRKMINSKRYTKFEHVYVWEKHNGRIPEGFHVHHVNEIKHDNRIENLELLDNVTHRRIHAGWMLKDDGWWSPCNKCGVLKKATIENFFRNNNRYCGIQHVCRVCDVKGRKERRLRVKNCPNIENRNVMQGEYEGGSR